MVEVWLLVCGWVWVVVGGSGGCEWYGMCESGGDRHAGADVKYALR